MLSSACRRVRGAWSMQGLAHLELRLGAQRSDDFEVAAVPVTAGACSSRYQGWAGADLGAEELDIPLSIVAAKDTDMLPMLAAEHDDVAFLQGAVRFARIGRGNDIEMLP